MTETLYEFWRRKGMEGNPAVIYMGGQHVILCFNEHYQIDELQPNVLQPHGRCDSWAGGCPCRGRTRS